MYQQQPNSRVDETCLHSSIDVAYYVTDVTRGYLMATSHSYHPLLVAT